MAVEYFDIRKQFERGVVILSFDTEQIWGYLDLLTDVGVRSPVPRRAGGSFEASCIHRGRRPERHLVRGGRHGALPQRGADRSPNGGTADRMDHKDPMRC